MPMGFSVMLRDAEKLVPAEYWCPYGTTSMAPVGLRIQHFEQCSK